MDNSKAIPCPHCGSGDLESYTTEHGDGRWVGFVSCNGCKRYSVTDFLYSESEAKNEAIRLWNRNWVS